MPVDASGTSFELAGPDSAPAVALIHGIGLNRGIWDGYRPVLAERYRVLSYDLPGHGASSPATDRITLSLLSEQLRRLMDETGIERAALIGFSLGGMINRRFAMDHPDRVSALAILNSPHERAPDEQQAVEERVRRTNEGGPAATLEASLRRWFTPAFIHDHRDIVDRAGEWVLAADPTSYAECREILATGVKELIRPQPPIAAPALIMTCENDSGSTPAMSHGISAEIAGAETIVVPNLQHMGLVEEPDLFIRPLLRFLGRVDECADVPERKTR